MIKNYQFNNFANTIRHQGNNKRHNLPSQLIFLTSSTARCPARRLSCSFFLFCEVLTNDLKPVWDLLLLFVLCLVCSDLKQLWHDVNTVNGEAVISMMEIKLDCMHASFSVILQCKNCGLSHRVLYRNVITDCECVERWLHEKIPTTKQGLILFSLVTSKGLEL